MKNKIALIILIIDALFTGCMINDPIVVNDYESCIQAHGIMLKSYPAQCLFEGNRYRKEL